MRCVFCYRGLERLVVQYFIIDVKEDLEDYFSYTLLSMLLRTCNVSCPILCFQWYRGLVMLVVLCFVIDVIEDV
jgi:hypothetical protein